MSRSKWKAPAAHTTLSKSSVIFPSNVSSSVSVSNGKTSITFKVSQPMVGHRVGEFYLFQKFTVSKKKANVRGKR
jgi:ribosomal protein S19